MIGIGMIVGRMIVGTNWKGMLMRPIHHRSLLRQTQTFIFGKMAGIWIAGGGCGHGHRVRRQAAAAPRFSPPRHASAFFVAIADRRNEVAFARPRGPMQCHRLLQQSTTVCHTGGCRKIRVQHILPAAMTSRENGSERRFNATTSLAN